jgi:gliding motility-associated-like protein
MDFIIFDRWGNKVFESENPNDGWNGNHNNNGAPMNMGTYVWYLKATLHDGTSIEKKGNVTLVR